MWAMVAVLTPNCLHLAGSAASSMPRLHPAAEIQQAVETCHAQYSIATQADVPHCDV